MKIKQFPHLRSDEFTCFPSLEPFLDKDFKNGSQKDNLLDYKIFCINIMKFYNYI